MAQGGQAYWLSIASLAPADAVIWGWVSGTGGDDASWQTLNGAAILRGRDRAFSLEGEPVPEPTALTLLALTGLAIARRARRRT